MTTAIEAIALLDAVLGKPTDRRPDDLTRLGFAPWMMSGIQTKGCLQCGGTMYRTVDHNGSGGPYVCSNPSCGAVE